MNEEEQLAAVRNGRSIQWVKNPSVAVKLAAVQQYGEAIHFIKNPSDQVKLVSVQQNGYVGRQGLCCYYWRIFQNGTRVFYAKCGNDRYSTSTGICGYLTLGSGKLDDYGYWEHPCHVCEDAWIKEHPNLIHDDDFAREAEAQGKAGGRQ